MEDETINPRYFYAVPSPFSQINVAVPPPFLNQIIQGDSLKLLRQLPDNCIDLVVTSPPYNFNMEYDTYKDILPWDQYFSQMQAIFLECIRVLKYGGRLVINIQPACKDAVPTHHFFSSFLMQHHMIWMTEILWEKNNYNCAYTAWGSWKSPSSPYMKYTWEFIEVFAKGTLKKDGDTSNITITGDQYKKWTTAKWSIAPEANMDKYHHPAVYPEELVVRVLHLFSYRGDVILDPFNGTGTTSKVAKDLGRKFIGFDLSEEYCQIARDRVKYTVTKTNLNAFVKK